MLRMFTHFASADSADDTYFQGQVDRFTHFKKLLKVKPRWIHVDNTAASVFNKKFIAIWYALVLEFMV